MRLVTTAHKTVGELGNNEGQRRKRSPEKWEDKNRKRSTPSPRPTDPLTVSGSTREPGDACSPHVHCQKRKKAVEESSPQRHLITSPDDRTFTRDRDRGEQNRLSWSYWLLELAVLQSSPHAQQKKRPAGSHRLSREESRDPEYVKLNVNSGLFGAEADSETDVIIMEENLTHG